MSDEPAPTSATRRGAWSAMPRSLAFRVIVFSTVWAILALIAISTVIAALYRQTSERGFDSLLSAHRFNLIGSVGVSPNGILTGAPDLGDLRFSEPRSGWYWSVEPVSSGLTGTLRSSSMTAAVPSPSAAAVPFDASFQRSYVTTGLAGEQIKVVESEFVLDGQNRAARFRVMGNLTELADENAAFAWRLFGYLAAFGVGMIAINAVAILLGLRPLRAVREALARVREGNAHNLGGSFPAEIEPLANEMNALIDNNRRIVDRARTQVGNLAHSLKTPLAVIVNEADALGGDRGRLLADQANAMRGQVEHYLQRARIAAQRDSVVFRTQVIPVIERMVRVMGKLDRRVDFALDAPPGQIVFAGEREDLEEMLGNLLENAMKWARSRARVSVVPEPEDLAGRFRLVIEDDGPGIPPEQIAEVLKRGRRLDETKPGTGLGLSIVSDLVKEYGGTIELDRSRLGGLRVTIVLRQAQ